MDICERILKIIEKEGLNVSSFARKLGVGDQTVRGIVIQRRNKPGFDLLVKIIQTFNWLNVEWLMTGEGKMMKIDDSKGDSSNFSMEFESYLRERDRKIEELIEENTILKCKCGIIDTKD